MESSIITKDKIRVEYADELMRFGLKVAVVSGSVIGIWAVTCMLVCLVDLGPLEMIRGYITAITGR